MRTRHRFRGGAKLGREAGLANAARQSLELGAARGLGQADAEHLAALSAGFNSLARGAGRHFGGGDVRQTIIEMSSGFLFVTAAGQGTCLAVLTGAEADIGQVAYEMAILVQRTGEHLQVGTRAPSALQPARGVVVDAIT